MKSILSLNWWGKCCRLAGSSARLPGLPPASTFGLLDVKLADDVWQVIVDTLVKYDGIYSSPELRQHIEDHTQITPFDGGVFISDGNEFDLFVVPEKRGKWAIRKEINAFLAKLAQEYSKAIVKIYPENKPSLRLALGFGFEPVGMQDRQIVLERALWVA